jgi:hypothetical protein
MKVTGVNSKWGKPILVVIGILLLLFAIINYSCTTKPSQKSPEQPKPETQALNPKKPNMYVWKEALYPELNKKDTLYFFNNDSIILRGTISNPPQIRNGKLAIKNSDVVKIVKPYTRGLPDKIIRDDFGTMIGMVVWYSLQDESFKIWYTMEDYARWEEGEAFKKDPSVIRNPINDSGSFILNGSAKIFHNGLESDVIAKSKNVFGCDDRLMVEGDVTDDPVIDVAEGRNAGSVNNEPQPELLKKESVGVKGQGKMPYAPK